MPYRRQDTLPEIGRSDSEATRWSAAKIVVVYLSFGIVWMLATVTWMGFGAAMVWQALFILLSAGLVAILVRHLTGELERIRSLLRDGERRYYQLAELLPQPVYEADPDGRITFANRKAFTAFGFTEEDFAQGINILKAVAPHDQDRAHQSRVGLLAGVHDPGTATQYTVRRKDGSTFPAIVCTAPLIRRGNAVGTCGVVADISEQKQREAEISRLNLELEQRVQERTAELASALKHMESFSYSISHDLRAPLCAIEGFSRVLIEDFGEQLPPRMLLYLQRISHNVHRMASLIDDILVFSRYSLSPLQKRPVQIADLVRAILDELLNGQDDRRVQVTVGDLPPCESDPTLLRQVLFNLLDNALKYSRYRDPAIIEVNAVMDGPVPVYFVRDNGAGFDMEYVHKLFSVFERLHGREEFEGTGVGLAIVQNIIQRHGGDVWAEGAVGQGSTFYFTLPSAPN
ncbi:multi-sensor signal transduction histidine kinase [Geobacter metallireducens RCH3]|uniref:histidine kinase n=1 Tax=Geobacter metallireducens (strain ATCC 53774 / DSM 7210 / GS-15) TaxID=269799 RepID=Q39WC5_GEOMG|nr:ATP-binding protein [Geobacter metallireducens]ABB31449.1 sensor histidine kinase, PAS domain-containing [Geobacter metallireducens GS-15]EHP88465.1 multi-sensor signal transduction histidine kinase [Geobacter metallireducens RCH3]